MWGKNIEGTNPDSSLVPSLFSLARGEKESGEVPIQFLFRVMLVVYDVFNVAMCANDLMFACWQENQADCFSFRHHTQTMGYLIVNRQLDFHP